MLCKYPIDLHHFKEIRDGGYIYIDKTEYIYRLAEEGLNYFLSRPKGFGKSLLVDTIMELFNGNKALFEGLWIHDKWDWDRTYPVIHFDYSQLNVETIGLKAGIYLGLQQNAKRLGITLSETSYSLQFRELIINAALKGNGKVVILIDDHDYPITEYMEDAIVLQEHLSILENFYSILKGSGFYIRFFLMTGAVQFTCPSIFSSSLDHLCDITMATRMGDILGITHGELENNFAQEIGELQLKNPAVLTEIKAWYGGYTWNMQSSVYHTFSLIKFMANRIFNRYWFERSMNGFLVRLLNDQRGYELEGIQMGELSLSTFDGAYPHYGSLLFQMGYLTIKEISESGQVYTLGYPNLEVEASLALRPVHQ